MDDDYADYSECKYSWTYEVAMRRLLNLLRQSQSDCTSNECLNEASNILQSQNESFCKDIMRIFISIWYIIAFCLFLMRPNRMRNLKRKNRLNESDSDRDPPASIK